jgi:alpha-mannosidase
MVSRRKFLKAAATSFGAATVMAVPNFTNLLTAQVANLTRSVQASSKNKVLHIIGYAHVDAAYLWPWRDGSNVALTTFRSALDRMNETPWFRYSHSSAIHYDWVQHADPRMFEEIRRRIQEGRLEVVGGWPVEADCNIPSTESFMRHCLYGKEYFQRELGVDVNIGFNPDSFGHAAGLPSILKGAGYKYYVFMRPQEHEMNLPLLFWWEGSDGSRVLTLRIRGGYSRSAARLQDAAENNFPPGFNNAAFFLGIGDHGGGFTKEQISEVLEMQKDPHFPELRWSTLREFFAAIEQSPAIANLPVISSELQHHARGCYSAYGEGKQNNRRAERWLVQGETISSVANLSQDYPYPGQEYTKAWAKLLFNQFHDLMAGSALYVAHRDSRDSVGGVCDTAQSLRIETLEALARRVDTRSVKEGAVFLFNCLPWARRTLVEYQAEKNPSRPSSPELPISHFEAQDKQKIPLQWRPADSMTQDVPRLSAWVDLPACGYKVLELVHGTPPEPEAFNDFFTVSDRGFGISSLKAPDGKELLANPVGLIVISDTSDTWGHGVSKFRQEIARPAFISSEVVEAGPVTRVTRQRAKWASSEIVLDIAQFQGVEAIELRFVIDWHEHEQILKLEVPTALAIPRVFAKVPGAAIERRPNGEEEPYQDWVALQGKIGPEDYTVGLINDSTYSYDCLQGLLRTILIRSAPFSRQSEYPVLRNDNNAWQDQGRQERRFWLVRGKGSVAALELDRLAEELQSPAEYIMDSAHEGTEPWEQSFLRVSPGSIWVTTIKRAESSEGIIIRLQERRGAPSAANLTSPLLRLDHKVKLAPWEIKTLLVKSPKGKHADVREVSLLEK